MSDAYQEGYLAFKEGVPLEDNPYQQEADNRSKWDEGWEDAKIDGDLKRGSICSERKK